MLGKVSTPGLMNCGIWSILTVLALFSSCTQKVDPPQKYDQFFEVNGSWSASHILVSYQGASRAQSHVTRQKEEALEKAVQLQARLLEEPFLFDEIARSESDGPAARVAGYLGAWETGAMAAEFQDALELLEIGGLTSEPVESPFGFHIIRREPTLLKHYACDALIIAYKGSPSVPAVITRTKEEARALAEKINETINGRNFDEVAEKHNDLSKGAMPLDVVHERTALPFDMVGALDPIAYGEVAGPIEMPIGFAFLRRKLVERFAGAHILVSYVGAKAARSDVTRQKDAARTHAAQLAEQLQAEPALFSELAKAHSNGPNADRGGYLGVWFRGKMLKAFDDAIAALPMDGIAPEPVETEYGFHVIMRKAVPGEGK